ncbi:MAG: micrococcal nuclease-like nuclease, partial [Cyanobium sp. Prado107]|nr:micrococcal nuclease-like nuclease [Cyanobium sp. Prado107]
MPALAAAQSRSGTVVSIGDGDTLRVRQGQRTITVRLACIDATEMAQQP